MARGSKKKRQQDFQKVKLKVGKKLKKADNETNASFKTRSIQIRTQLKKQDGSQPSTRKKQNLSELLTQCRHYSASVRHEAATGLRELITNYPELLLSHPADVLEKAGELLSDKDSVVRQASIKLFKVILGKMSEKHISPFFPLLCAHLCCAMTHINDEIQVDSLTMLDYLLESHPALMISRSSQVLGNFIEQISRQSHGQSKRMLTSNPNSKTSSQKWRASVLTRLQAFLLAILTSHGVTEDVDDGATNKRSVVQWDQENALMAQSFPMFVKNHWEAPGFIISSSSLEATATSEEMFGGKFHELTETLMPLLLECWLECITGHNQATQTGSVVRADNAAVMVSVLEVTCLLLKCRHILPAHTQQERMETVPRSMADFQQHLLAHFPYTIQEGQSSNPGKKKDKVEKVGAETLNLCVCDVMTHFLNSFDRKKGPPEWLSIIIRYVEDFLAGRYDTTVVGPSARMVVQILDTMMETGLDIGSMVGGLLSAVYQRYQAANPLSQQKRIYLQFLAKHVTPSDRFEHQQAFLQSLPELLPLVAKDQPHVAALILETMRKVACQRCEHCLQAISASANGCKWFDPEDGAIIHLPSDKQRQLIGLLYFLPSLGAELLKQCARLVYSERLSGDTVKYLLQLIHNRYLTVVSSQEESTVYISFLSSLVLGMSKANIDAAVSRHVDARDVALTLGGFSLLDSDPENITTEYWDRHTLILQTVSSVITQFYNTEQVSQIMLKFLSTFITSLPAIPLPVTYGVCHFIQSLSSFCKIEDVTFINLSISLVYFTVMTWEKSTNQELRKSLQVLACNLVTSLPQGMTLLLEAVQNALKDAPCHHMNLLLKCVLLFLSEGRQQYISTHPNIVSLLNQVVETAKKSQPSDNKPSLETERLLTSLEYLVSQVI